MAETAPRPTPESNPAEAPTLPLPISGDPGSAEAPTVPDTTYDPNEVTINYNYPGKSIDPGEFVLNQLEADAASRGRADMVGLQWRDQSGALNRISHQEKVEKVSIEPEKDGVLPSWKKFTRGHVAGGPILERKEKDKEVTETQDYYTVDVIEEEVIGEDEAGNKIVTEIVTDVVTHKGRGEFVDYFKVRPRANHNALGDDVPRPIFKPRWTDRQESPQPVGYERLADVGVRNSKDELIPMDGLGRAFQKDPVAAFQAIDEHRVTLGLEGWTGLTWMDYKASKKDKKMVVDDRVIIRNGKYPDRVLKIKTIRADKTIDYDNVPLTDPEGKNDLAHHFSDRQKKYPNAPLLDLHWEKALVPSSEESTRSEEAAVGTDIHLDEAYMLLSYPELCPDIKEGHIAQEAYIQQLMQQPTMQKYAHRLKETMAEVDSVNFIEVVTELHDSYKTDMRKLGLQISPEEDKSISWILKGLMQVRDYGDPFEDSAKGQVLRSLPIALQLGMQFSTAAVTEGKAMKKPDLDKSDPANIKVEEKIVIPYQENLEVTNRLRTLLYKEQIKELALKRKITADPEPTQAELIDIGLSLRWSFGRK